METRIKRWEAAIEKGLNVDMAVGKINELVEEKKVNAEEAKGTQEKISEKEAQIGGLLQKLLDALQSEPKDEPAK